MRYERLMIDCELQEETEQYIDRDLDYLNNGGEPLLDECFRTEVDLCFCWESREGYITSENFNRLRNYYVHGGNIRAKEGEKQYLDLCKENQRKTCKEGTNESIEDG